ncbi:MAG TPA: DEAD/DEAH box helicase [Candidatus Saccharimonadales bacterium]|nr:DEAD/DEAH box helicase [Candidatus Saccharimonadales bacterium]
MSYVYRSGQRTGARRGPARAHAARRKQSIETINPARFVKPARAVQAEVYVPLHSFETFGLQQLLLRNIQARGFTAPSPIQDQAIPYGLAGQDVIGVANTGTGKTVAFALPILQHLLQNPAAQALVLAPTRELAAQIEDECRLLAKGSGLYGVLLIGGTSMGTQLRRLQDRPQLVIGTPGRVKDHLTRGTLDLSGFTACVLDEVDRMLDMGFVNDIRWILGRLPDARQSLFFTATLNASVTAIIREFAREPVTISVSNGDTTENVAQDIVRYSGTAEQLERLHDLLLGAPKALVFDETQRKVERLGKELAARGFAVDAIHGGKTQGQRQRALTRFRAGEVTVLVATDVAARGLDIRDVTHVINFSTPHSYDDYIHRIGRAGRAGNQGYAFTFVQS